MVTLPEAATAPITEPAAPAPEPTPAPAAPAKTGLKAFYDEDTAEADFAKLVAPEEPPEPPKTEAPTEPTPEPPAGDTPPAPTAEAPKETPAEPERILPHRISTKQFPPLVQKAIALFGTEEGKAMGMEACLVVIREQESAAKEQAETQKAHEEARAASDPVTTLSARIAEIDAALDGVEDGSLMSKDVLKMIQERQDKVSELSAAKMDRKRQEAEVSAKQEQFFSEGKRLATEEFPLLKDPESLFFKTVMAEANRRYDEGDSIFDDPMAPVLISREIAKREEDRITKYAEGMSKEFGVPLEQAKAVLRGHKPIATAAAPVTPPAAPVVPAAPVSKPAGQKDLTATGGPAPASPVAKPPLSQEEKRRSLIDPNFDFDGKIKELLEQANA